VFVSRAYFSSNQVSHPGPIPHHTSNYCLIGKAHDQSNNLDIWRVDKEYNTREELWRRIAARIYFVSALRDFQTRFRFVNCSYRRCGVGVLIDITMCW
jgi:hypothetical protein